MRSLATALGCLVIASYATVGTATTGYDDEIVASCHFGDNGYVIFRQKAGEIQKPALKGRKRMLPQLVGPAAALDQEEEEVEEDAEEAGQAIAVEGAKKVVQIDSEDEHEEEDECEQLSANGSADEDEHT